MSNPLRPVSASPRRRSWRDTRGLVEELLDAVDELATEAEAARREGAREAQRRCAELCRAELERLTAAAGYGNTVAYDRAAVVRELLDKINNIDVTG